MFRKIDRSRKDYIEGSNSDQDRKDTYSLSSVVPNSKSSAMSREFGINTETKKEKRNHHYWGRGFLRGNSRI